MPHFGRPTEVASLLARLPRPLQTVRTLLALSALGPGAPAEAQPAAPRRSPAPTPIQPEARHPLRCEPATIEPILVALCEALVAAPVLSDSVAVRIERPDQPPPAHATDPARRADLLRLGRSGDDLQLELRRPRHRRTLVARLPAVLGAEAGARAEALRLTLAFLLGAPPDAGEPWPEGGDERSPLPPRVAPKPPPPAIGALPAPPLERLRDLEGPSPFPLRPPLVVPGPAPSPRPGPAAVEALPPAAPGADASPRRAAAATSAAPEFDPTRSPRLWVGPAVLAGAEVEGGFSLGFAHPLGGPWHGRLASTVAPFGEAGGGPLTGFATSLALEYLLSVDAIRARLHAGFAHRATLPQWAQAQVEGRHRIAGAIGTTLETSIGGPLALALEFEASLATGETRARGISGERVEGPLTGRSALLLVWTL